METLNQADDERWMQRALALADEAARGGEVPVGAVAIYEGTCIGEGFNRREGDRDPLAHAELLALRQAAQRRDAWRLSGVTLYVTLEPCAMCAGAMVQSRVTRLVYGASDPKAGAAGSLYNLVEEPRHNHRVQVARGVMGEACSEVLSRFFRQLRVDKAAR